MSVLIFVYSTVNFPINLGFEIVQVKSAMHCTRCTIGICCHVTTNGSFVPSMVLRYWRDGRVGKETNQHGNGFALATYIGVVRRHSTSTYSHPTFGFATAGPPLIAECCVGPEPCAFGNATPSLRCAHWSAASLLAIAHRHRFATDKARLPSSRAGCAESYPEPALPPPSIPSLSSPVSDSVPPTPGHVLDPADKPPCAGGLYHRRSRLVSAVHAELHWQVDPFGRVRHLRYRSSPRVPSCYIV